jgi:hypothetical protein
MVIVSVGCTHAQLARSTVNQASTLTDLQYQQVLDNIAMFVKNPYTVPWHVVPVVGTAQVTDTGQTTPQFTFQNTGPGLSQFGIPVQGSRGIQESWTLVPAVYNSKDPKDLKLPPSFTQNIVLGVIRTLYQTVIDYPNPNGEWFACSYHLRSGWFSVGKKKDVPKDACYVGCYKGTYVWVMPEGLEDLANTTMAVLDIVHARGATIGYGAGGPATPPLTIAVPTNVPTAVPPAPISTPVPPLR